MELTVNHRAILNNLENTIPKETRYLFSTGSKIEKFNGSSFHLGITVETKRNRVVFETKGYMWCKNGLKNILICEEDRG